MEVSGGLVGCGNEPIGCSGGFSCAGTAFGRRYGATAERGMSEDSCPGGRHATGGTDRQTDRQTGTGVQVSALKPLLPCCVVAGGAEGDDEAAGDQDDDGEGDGDDDADEAALGDLLEALDEDEGLDSGAKLRAQFALQSMFNQPADELTAKGARGGAGGDDGGAAAAPPEPPSPRGTTGMARDVSDDDGGAAPPPMLPKPRPRRR